MPKTIVEKNWDYSSNADYYKFRPNYPAQAIDLLAHYVGARKIGGFLTADIGAGTGNLTVLLRSLGLSVIAVEPNDSMRDIGIKRTAGTKNVKWLKATGIQTTLKAKSVNWVTFGSSFNVMDRNLALKETHRILKSDGFFTCMWNHRDLNDPIQKIAEDTIVKFVPEYERGVRREDQRPVLEENKKMFENIFYSEHDFTVERTIDEYINAWRSVKNRYWDLSTTEGNELFGKITATIENELPPKFSLRYTMRAWTAQKV